MGNDARIFIVDDDADLSPMLLDIVQRLGYQVDAVSAGAVAVER